MSFKGGRFCCFALTRSSLDVRPKLFFVLNPHQAKTTIRLRLPCSAYRKTTAPFNGYSGKLQLSCSLRRYGTAHGACNLPFYKKMLSSSRRRHHGDSAASSSSPSAEKVDTTSVVRDCFLCCMSELLGGICGSLRQSESKRSRHSLR